MNKQNEIRELLKSVIVSKSMLERPNRLNSDEWNITQKMLEFNIDNLKKLGVSQRIIQKAMELGMRFNTRENYLDDILKQGGLMGKPILKFGNDITSLEIGDFMNEVHNCDRFYYDIHQIVVYEWTLEDLQEMIEDLGDIWITPLGHPTELLDDWCDDMNLGLYWRETEDGTYLYASHE